MSATNRVKKLEGGDGLCPTCGHPKPIEIIEVIVPITETDKEYATADERAALDRIGQAIRARQLERRGTGS